MTIKSGSRRRGGGSRRRSDGRPFSLVPRSNTNITEISNSIHSHDFRLMAGSSSARRRSSTRRRYTGPPFTLAPVSNSNIRGGSAINASGMGGGTRRRRVGNRWKWV